MGSCQYRTAQSMAHIQEQVRMVTFIQFFRAAIPTFLSLPKNRDAHIPIFRDSAVFTFFLCLSHKCWFLCCVHSISPHTCITLAHNLLGPHTVTEGAKLWSGGKWFGRLRGLAYDRSVGGLRCTPQLQVTWLQLHARGFLPVALASRHPRPSTLRGAASALGAGGMMGRALKELDVNKKGNET